MIYRCALRAHAAGVAALILLLTIGVAVFPTNGWGAPQPPAKVYRISLSGTVDPLMVTFVKRVVRDVDVPGAVCIFEIDTFGGRVDSAFQIVDTLLGMTHARTIAYVAPKAISAGALLALACNEIVMENNATIGDCAPITYSNEGPQMMGEKFQSPIRAKFRTLARRNGYPEALAEAMVTLEMAVVRIHIHGETRYLDSRDFDDLSAEEKAAVTSKKTVVKKGELLTMDDTEARELGFSRMSVLNIEELLDRLKLGTVETVTVKKDGVETFFGFIAMVAPILMLIGLGAIYTEIKTPGFGAPGAIGILCLGLFFIGQYIVGLADYAELLLIALGFLLLAIEVFVIPGFGVAGIGGAICIAIGMVLSLQDFVLPDPEFPWEMDLFVRNLSWVFGSIVLAFIMSMFAVRYLIPRLSRVVEGPYLDTTLKASHADSREAVKIRVGDAGTALTQLRPSGKMALGDWIVDVITEGEFIEAQTAVTVSKIDGNRVIVIRSETS